MKFKPETVTACPSPPVEGLSVVRTGAAPSVAEFDPAGTGDRLCLVVWDLSFEPAASAVAPSDLARRLEGVGEELKL
jgi:hypothetical protein